ncbi:MAG: aspartate--tRNA ligase [Finegoldia sp.]|nr:aspartate--tRNA ligase [Finegoldia sp.]
MEENKLHRSHMAGELRKENIGQEVTLMGWVNKKRNLGSLIFIDLRDISGLSQIVVNESDSELFEIADSTRNEFVLAVEGLVRERESKNPNIATGDVEVVAKNIVILDKSEVPPIYIKDDDDAQDAVRLKYRYLDLRKSSLQKNLILRSKVNKIVRDYLNENSFIEIETPFLGKATPEGARDYLVPSRINEHKFYALPQSPQIYKQLLMVAGMDRYFQIAKCFRDEDLRANRQPEFTQIDMEMSFVDQEDIIALNEGLIKRVFKEAIGVDVQTPIKRLSYKEAMESYGSDKPDLRFGFKLQNITDLVKNSQFKVFSDASEEGKSVRCINIGNYEDQYSRKKVDKLESFVKEHGAKGLSWIRVHDGEIQSPIKKFLSDDEINAILERTKTDENALILILADKDSIVFNGISALRNKIARDLDIIDKDEYNFVWIVDFPMFEYDEDEGRFVSVHHPFTMPNEEDIKYLKTDKARVRARAYDIVCNGDELGGGSIRINNSDLQREVFEALDLDDKTVEEKFGFFVEAFNYGAPPHGGLAYGMDRLMMLLTKTDNIKDVIAFPKTQSATDLMTQAPGFVSEEQLDELNIKLD